MLRDTCKSEIELARNTIVCWWWKDLHSNSEWSRYRAKACIFAASLVTPTPVRMEWELLDAIADQFMLEVKDAA